MNPNVPVQFVSATRERVRRTPLLWALVFVFGASACVLATRLGWWSHGVWAAAFLGPLSAAFVARWFYLGRTLTPVALARQLDERLELQSRLEAAVELKDASTALAEAQRSDTIAHTQVHRNSRALDWFGALAAAVMLAALLAVEVGLEVTHRFLQRPATPHLQEMAQATALVDEKQKSPATDYSGRIVWRTPESEIKATSIEEVPLQAVAESKVGYKKLTLEIALNGEPKLSRPVETTVLDTAGKAGSHPISLSLYLDEVGAQEFDVVSYHLRGELAPDAPAINSPLQFIQIRPSREDVTQSDEGGDSNGRNLMNVVRELKIAQLELLKQNFQLASATSLRDDPVWRETNSEVAADQETLSTKTSELRETAIKEGLPVIVVDNLAQASPLMKSAAKDIAEMKNEPATKPQGQALALLTATEKILRKSMAPAQKDEVQDPFKDKQQYALSSRGQTAAGRLEELAKKQAEIARALGESATDQVSAQSDVARELDRLLAEKALDPDVQIDVASAGKDAAEASRQLTQNDVVAARGPAAAAAEALAHAVQEQERKGRQNALAELNQSRRELNRETSQEQSSRAEQLRKLADKLGGAAEHQQQQGSNEAAQQLSELSKNLREQAQKAETPGSAPAGQMARTEAELGGMPAALGRAANQLERAEKAMAGSGGAALQESALSDAQMAAQMAGAILPDATGRTLADDVATTIKADPKGGNGPAFELLKNKIHRLVLVVEEARAKGKREEIVRRFNPADFDPAYRKAIEEYFERLSREGAAR
ncbi:MAG: hypothetical protein QM715_04755 [Nibricoccus sp.]